MKAKVYQIEVKPFHTQVNVCISDSMNSAIKYTNKYHSSKPNIEPYKDDTYIGGTYYKSVDGHYFIFLKYSSTIHDIVHEAFHAVMKIAYERGAEYSYESDEFFAYSYGEFTETLMNNFYSIKQVKKLNE